MSRDIEYKRSDEFREISDRDLYYDLEYNLAKKDAAIVQTSTVILYLFITSGILQLFFQINQTITFLMIILYALLRQFFPDHFDTTRKSIVLILILVGNILDHINNDIIVLPGQLTSENISMGTWFVEIVWILFFGVEFLSLYAPIQKPATEGRTVTPATEFTKTNYQGLKDRITGSKYSITNFDEEVDTSLLQITFRNLVQYLIIIFVLIVALDLLAWEIISGIAGGNNVEEEYLVSGVSFVIYLLILVFSGYFFPSGNSSAKK